MSKQVDFASQVYHMSYNRNVDELPEVEETKDEEEF